LMMICAAQKHPYPVNVDQDFAFNAS
jgi:hypothetical protein